jgi:hypothetical protein
MLDNYFIPPKNDCLIHVDPKLYIKYPPMIMMLCFFVFKKYVWVFKKKFILRFFFFQIINKGSGTKHGHIPQLKE